MDIPSDADGFEVESAHHNDDEDEPPSSVSGPRSSRFVQPTLQGFPFGDDAWNEDIRLALRHLTGNYGSEDALQRVPPLPPKAEAWALRLNGTLIRDTLKILANLFISTRRTNAVNSIRDTLVLLAHELPTLLPRVLESDNVCQFYYSIITR